MGEKNCEWLPPSGQPVFRLVDGYSHDECMLKNGHKGPHLNYVKEKGEYIAWEMIDEASGMRNICEECPWASDDHPDRAEECNCIYHVELTKTEANQAVSQNLVEQKMQLCSRF